MKVFLLLVSFSLLSAMHLSAQSSVKVRYYLDKNLSKKTTEDKANFSRTIVHSADTFSTEIKNMKTNEIIWSESYKGDEPIGVWKNSENGGIDRDYNFVANYKDTICTNSTGLSEIDNCLEDNLMKGYIAPKLLTGEKDLTEFIKKNIAYPPKAIVNGVKGKVFIKLVISESGKVEDIAVKRSVDVLLDKEAVRVIRQLKFSLPAMLNGVKYRLCIVVPIAFN